ncbi:UNVERIFIED_CONTAM: Retrovirus-related Pol polyprotein from transposon TNT 1-94 [Sesamum radiatum]|uniref:Retrovirus-related Pol polyprotein from transposon TNT 1-94 n=1 Tax=Sesamum radiatum TaxID=300843 RepID=A0AAW2TYK7_SESRA
MLVQYEVTTHKSEPAVLEGEASTSKAKDKGARRWKGKKGKGTVVTASASTGGAPAAPKGKGQGKVGGSQRSKANDVCMHCQGKGHWKRECPQLLSNPGMFVVEVLERSRKLSKDEMILRLGNGKAVAVEAVGSLSLVWTPLGMPQLISVAERRNRTLLDMVRSMMSFTEFAPSFWGYALETAAKLLNIAPSKSVPQTPYEESSKEPQPYSTTSFEPMVHTDSVPVLRRSTRESRVPESLELTGRSRASRPEVEFEETYSPVAMTKSIHILLAIAAWYDYEIWQMDVKTAFLNGFVEEEIFMDQSEGFTAVGEEQKVCRLQRSIYCLKQTSRSWNTSFDEVIRGYDFIKIDYDPCIYKTISGSSVAYLVLYVDDILLIRNDVKMLGDIKAWLSTQFSMKDMGETSYILGIKIYRDRFRRMLRLT